MIQRSAGKLAPWSAEQRAPGSRALGSAEHLALEPAEQLAPGSAARPALHLAALAGPPHKFHIKWPTRPPLQVCSDDPPMTCLIQRDQFNLNNLIRSTPQSGVRLCRCLPNFPGNARSLVSQSFRGIEPRSAIRRQNSENHAHRDGDPKGHEDRRCGDRNANGIGEKPHA